MIKRRRQQFLALAAIAGLIPSSGQAADPPAATPDYKLTRTVSLGAPDRWDYVVFDAPSHRVYVAHGDRITVVDAELGKVIGQVEGFPGGTHGVAISTATGKGFSDDGAAGTVSSFDLKTLKRGKTLKAEPDADGMVIDPATHHLFVIDGDSGKITVIDPKTESVISTIDGGGGLEFGVADGAGKFFVDGAEKNEIVAIDTATNKVVAHWPMAGCVKPHGIAMDRLTHRLFASCANRILTVVNSTNGAVVTTLPIGERNDGAAFDAERKLIFASNGDGTISVIRAVDANNYVSLGAIPTAVTGRTMDIDPGTGRLYLAAAKVDSNAPLAANGRPQLVPGSLQLMFLDPVEGGHSKLPALTIEQARVVALKARPGRIVEQELEHEKGGSGLRYSFDIDVDGVKYEVGVDAHSGEILENGTEKD
jgi:YVTN family beta-propeller protein